MKIYLSIILSACFVSIYAQTNPAITSWIRNAGEMGSHYEAGNSTPIQDNILANVERVSYNSSYAYIEASGIPAYVIGPYLDGNPSQASDNEHVYQIPINPQEQIGNKTDTHAGITGTLINGVPIYDWRDAQSYNNQGVWNRDAILNELDGFDCQKGHPSPIFSGGGGPGGGGMLSGGTYHHHQNPSAFDEDLQQISNICDLYPADGLYSIVSTIHSPLLGFALDGFPIYGPYAYANTDGTGGIVRMESSYALRNITNRTHYADGTNVTDGPPVNSTYPLGTYMEDYEYTGSGHLDEYNGRFAVTPEYPDGIYAYFLTVDENHNSQFPYSIGPHEYYGVVNGSATATVPNNATVYNPVILPTEFIDFTVEKREQHIFLEWETEQEINLDHYILERSIDHNTFETIHKVDSQNNTTELNLYNYEDYDFSTGLMYYRLKAVDIDGSINISKTISIRIFDESFEKLNCFPNPADAFVAIQYPGLLDHNIKISLFTLSGDFIESTEIKQGSTLAYINTTTLYNGLYLLHIENQGEHYFQKILIQHF